MLMVEFERDGVWVTRVRARGAGVERPPLIFVHGGAHASWCWEHHLAYFAARGWECLAFDWYNHGRSKRTDVDTFRQRGIEDVQAEIGIVAELVDRPPVLVGHSMGALAAQVYAVSHMVAGLALLAPVLPAVVGAPPLKLPISFDDLVPPFPFPLARQLFFTSLDEPLARRYAAMLDVESPQAVLEASLWTVDVAIDMITAPTLVIAGGRDALIPHESARVLATMLGAEHVLLDRAGHDDMLLHDGTWQDVAGTIEFWLAAR